MSEIEGFSQVPEQPDLLLREEGKMNPALYENFTFWREGEEYSIRKGNLWRIKDGQIEEFKIQRIVFTSTIDSVKIMAEGIDKWLEAGGKTKDPIPGLTMVVEIGKRKYISRPIEDIGYLDQKDQKDQKSGSGTATGNP